MSSFSNLLIAFPGDFNVFLARFLRFFLESVQHIHRLLKPRNVDDPPFALDVDADFIHASADTRHRLEIGRHQTALDGKEFKTSLAALRRGSLSGRHGLSRGSEAFSRDQLSKYFDKKQGVFGK
jgi:hypothetical protein